MASLRKVLELVTNGGATSRADIARRTGLARSTVSQRVDELIGHGLIEETLAAGAGRGRPPRILHVRANAGLLVVVDIDTQASRIAVADLSRTIIATDVVVRPVEDGPQAVVPIVVERIRALLDSLPEGRATVRQVVVGLPAPVDFGHGCAVRPPIMPGWDGYPVGDELRAALGAPVLVDNDANLMALGEASLPDVAAPLLFVRVGAGIGAGLVTTDGDVHRGADGSAGDIGHIRTWRHADVLCHCGKTGCLEAAASLRAILADLEIPEALDGDPNHGAKALAARVSTGDAGALRRIRQAATEIGDVVAMLVHVYNPRTLVLGGALSSLRDEVLAGVRAAVYEYALPLATRKLIITTSQLDGDAVLVGGVVLAARTVFAADGLGLLLSGVRP